MILLQGIDLVKNLRIKKIYKNHKTRFLNKILTNREINQILKKENFEKLIISLAGKFAVKEAASKAIGTGISKNIKFTDFEILNDVSGFKDPEMIELAVEKNSKIILVHNHPESSHIQEKMEFKNVVQEVKTHLELKINYLISKGIQDNQISVDPGLGFGKTMNDSLLLFKNLENFCFGFPLVVGYSKKKFTENLNMTDNQLYQHCIDSGTALVRLHIPS